MPLIPYIGEVYQPSDIPKRPTIVICGPQGCGKTVFSEALSLRFQTTSIFDDGNINGVPVDPTNLIQRDGGLVLGTDVTGGDLEIIVHTQAGFDALIKALRIPLEHRPAYSKDFAPGPSKEFITGMKGGSL